MSILRNVHSCSNKNKNLYDSTWNRIPKSKYIQFLSPYMILISEANRKQNLKQLMYSLQKIIKIIIWIHKSHNNNVENLGIWILQHCCKFYKSSRRQDPCGLASRRDNILPWACYMRPSQQGLFSDWLCHQEREGFS